MQLSERCFKFMRELGVPLSQFCRNINLSTTALRDWKKGRLKLSDSTLARIENYLDKYGF